MRSIKGHLHFSDSEKCTSHGGHSRYPHCHEKMLIAWQEQFNWLVDSDRNGKSIPKHTA